MRTWCATFASGADWFASGAETPAIDALGSCASPYVILETGEYNVIRDGYVAFTSGGGSTTHPPAPTGQFTVEEVAALKYQAANPSPFNLSIQDGSLVAGSIAAIWALGWVLRAFVQAINTDGET